MGQSVDQRIAVSRAPAIVNLAGLPHTVGFLPLFPWLSLAFAVFFGFCAWASDREQTEGRRLGMFIAFAVLTALFLWAFAHTLLTKVRLESDRATSRGLFGSRTLLRSEIAGFRRLDAASTAPSRLVPEAPGVRAITFVGAAWRPRDPVIDAWVEGYADLTPQRQAAPVAWQGDVTLLSRLMLGLGVVAVAVAVWGVLLPYQRAAALILAALLPWLGIAAVRLTWGAVAFDRPKGSKQPLAAVVVFAPLIALALRPVIDLVVLDWQAVVGALLGGAVAGAVGFALLFGWMRAGQRAWWFGPAAFGAVYFASVFVNIDTLADRAPGQIFRTEVISKSISTSRRGRGYHVRLAPWGPRTTEESEDVKHPDFNRLYVGGMACVTLHPGVFGVRWYTVNACDEPSDGQGLSRLSS